jgi:hypothetical protein
MCIDARTIMDHQKVVRVTQVFDIQLRGIIPTEQP